MLAASATSPEMLIIARVILAIGAAAMMPPTLSIIKRTFVDEQERAFALGVWSAITAAGAGLGPVIGGGFVGLLLLAFSIYNKYTDCGYCLNIILFICTELSCSEDRALGCYQFYTDYDWPD